MTKLERITWLVTIVLAAIVLLVGSFFFYWGSWNILIYPDHTNPVGIEYIFAINGLLILVFGALLPYYAGKKLTGKQLIVTSLAHLVFAPSLVFAACSVTDPRWIPVLIPPALFSNLILDVALLIGHFRKKPN